MATLQQKIADTFLEKLEKSEHLNTATIDQIRSLLGKTKTPKAEDFVKIFSLPAGGDLK